MPAVLILAGGMGTRLRSAVGDVPKPLAPAGGKPFLYYLVQHLVSLGFKEFIFSLYHQADLIKDYFKLSPDFPGVQIRYIIESQPLQTGGAILFTATQASLSKPFYVVNGDTLISGDITEVSRGFKEGHIHIGLSEVQDSSRYGTVEEDSAGRIVNFSEKQESHCSGIINAGTYFLELRTLEELGFRSGDVFSLERQIFPALLALRRVNGVKIPGDFIDIGIPSDYLRFKDQVEK